MKHQWLAYVVIGVLSIGAGVAIAGPPNNVPVDATIIPPTTTQAPAASLPETTVPEATVPETTEAAAGQSESTDPDTTAPDTTDPESGVLLDRNEIFVAAANGANVAGAAVSIATQLEELGYVDVLPLNGTDIVELTTVYFAEGFEAAALRMVEDLELLPDFAVPIEDAPSVADLPADIELLVYIGRDRA